MLLIAKNLQQNESEQQNTYEKCISAYYVFLNMKKSRMLCPPILECDPKYQCSPNWK